MIVTRTPYRVSLFGGGTDYPGWFNKYDGAVLAAAIEQYCYIAVRRREAHEDQSYKLVYSNFEQTKNISEIEHPVIREVLKVFKPERPLEIIVSSDIRAGVGIGSSSAFTVGLLNALHKLNAINPTPRQLAEEAIKVERELLGESGGFQDQITASYGGLNYIKFFKKNNFTVEPLNLSNAEMQNLTNSIILVDVGGIRRSSDISRGYGFLDEARVSHFHSTNQICSKAKDMFQSGFNLDRFSDLLEEAWTHKCRFSQNVTNEKIGAVFEKAFKAGATAGKLLGAGSAGICMFVVPPDRRTEFVERSGFEKLINVAIDEKGSQAFDLRAKP